MNGLCYVMIVLNYDSNAKFTKMCKIDIKGKSNIVYRDFYFRSFGQWSL